MHVTLICADNEIWAIGLRSISSVLKQAGHSTRIVLTCSQNGSLSTVGLESIRKLSGQSDLIGISSMSRSSKKAKAIIEALKPLGKPIVWGGMHPTLYPDDCVGHPDLICRGEGEEFMVDLAERLSQGRGYNDIPNGGFVQNGQIHLNVVRPLLADMDRLPFVDFSFSDEFRIDERGESRPNEAMKDELSILYSGSRGCAFNCHYCSNAQLKALYEGKGRYIRKMSIPKFVESAKRCRDIFPRAKYFYFTDEDFLARPIQEFREFAELYPEEVGLPFECMASPQQISEEKLDLLVKAGLWRVDVGVESGSDRIKKEIFNRHGSNDIVLRSASIVSRHPQVVAYYFFIIGNPYEKRDDLLGTVGLIRRLPYPAFVRTYNLVFMPGTHLFEKACKDGIINGLEDSGFDIDFLAGFDHRKHAWKMNNLYLNGLISLMTGKATRRRTGFIPRIILPALIRPRWLDFNDRYNFLSKVMIGLARGGLILRRKAMILASKMMKDPSSAYNVKGVAARVISKG
jgi:radical SAM superfamily enzyme YgiQ (UPF0313 family)